MNKTKSTSRGRHIKQCIGIIFAATLLWWGGTFIYALIEHCRFDPEMKKYLDTSETDILETFDYNFRPTGAVEVTTEFKSKESKLYIQATYLQQNGYSKIECNVEPDSKLVQNWIYLFKGGNWKKLSKEYVFTCHQQDISARGRKLAEIHYKDHGRLSSLYTKIKVHTHGSNLTDCDDAIAHSYSVYKDYACNQNSPGYNPDIGCIENECIIKGKDIIEKSYDEYGRLRKENASLYSKSFNEMGELIFESKGDYYNTKMYFYSSGRLVEESTRKEGKYQEIKKYDLRTGDVAYELYFKNGKPSHGYKYQNGNKTPMTNAHLQKEFGGRIGIGKNQTFKE